MGLTGAALAGRMPPPSSAPPTGDLNPARRRTARCPITLAGTLAGKRDPPTARRRRRFGRGPNPMVLLQEEPEEPDHRGPEVLAVHDLVDEAVLQEELRGLEALGDLG